MPVETLDTDIDCIKKHMIFLQENRRRCVRFFSAWDLLWRDVRLSEKFRDTAAGTGLQTIRMMSDDAILLAVLRMFEDHKHKNRSTSIKYCVDRLSDPVLLRHIAEEKFKGDRENNKWIDSIQIQIGTSPDDIEMAHKRREKREKNEFWGPLYISLLILKSFLDCPDTINALKRLRNLRNKMVAHNDIDISPDMEKGTHRDVKRLFNISDLTITTINNVFSYSSENMEIADAYSAYGTIYSLLSNTVNVNINDEEAERFAEKRRRLRDRRFLYFFKLVKQQRLRSVGLFH